MRIGDKVVALRDLPDEDIMTQLARGYENIPEGTELVVVDVLPYPWNPFYACVTYKGNTYAVKYCWIAKVSRKEDEQ